MITLGLFFAGVNGAQDGFLREDTDGHTESDNYPADGPLPAAVLRNKSQTLHPTRGVRKTREKEGEGVIIGGNIVL